MEKARIEQLKSEKAIFWGFFCQMCEDETCQGCKIHDMLMRLEEEIEQIKNKATK